MSNKIYRFLIEIIPSSSIQWRVKHTSDIRMHQNDILEPTKKQQQQQHTANITILILPFRKPLREAINAYALRMSKRGGKSECLRKRETECTKT